MTEVRYRTYIASLLEQLMGNSEVYGIATIDKRKVAEEIGVSHQTFYEWYNADSEDPAMYLFGYRAETEWRFRLFFARRLGLDPEHIRVVERIVLDPSCQERANFSVPVVA